MNYMFIIYRSEVILAQVGVNQESPPPTWWGSSSLVAWRTSLWGEDLNVLADPMGPFVGSLVGLGGSLASLVPFAVASLLGGSRGLRGTLGAPSSFTLQAFFAILSDRDEVAG